MAVDRLSVTVPSELGAALRALAERRGETVSTIVSDAIALQIRLAALDLALEESEHRYGSLDEQALSAAEAELARPPAPKRKPRRNRP